MGNLRFMTAGESHGPRLTAILEGIPAGLGLSEEAINKDLARRQQGYGRGGRMKIETDRVEILSGVRFGETLGGPVTLSVINKDWTNWTDRMAVFGEPSGEKVTAARPGHADLTGVRKYDREDIRDILERSSARETTMRVAAGAVAKQFLAALGIEISSRVLNIGGVSFQLTEVTKVLPDGNRLVRFDYEGIFLETLERLGKMPLPPYIKEELEDQERYQTVYSPASVTWGSTPLHFSLSRL